MAKLKKSEEEEQYDEFNINKSGYKPKRTEMSPEPMF